MNNPTSLPGPVSAGILIVALLIAFFSAAATAADRYQVEILVFRQNQPDGGEQWPVEPGFPDLQDSVAFDGDSKQISPLGADTLQLAGIREKLAGDGARRPVFHAAWEQSIISGKTSPQVHIVSPDGSMDGVVRVDRGRYLHLYLDLTSDGVRMQEKRRMRSKKIHHIDHPRMGVITLVTPVEKS